MGALHIVRADQPPRPPDEDLIEQWSNYMTACGVSPATIRIRTQTIKTLPRHAGVDSPLELTRNHVIAWLGRPLKPWSRKNLLECDREVLRVATGVRPRP